ncbi:MAG: thioesterase family protein [Salinisphaera sp.]|jgi:acyl-CoA thioester hydrolase|nr:thioesterase family protein [Salinisphaera sp.]
MPRPAPPIRADYRWFCDMPTRWMDNDVYGHVNNVTYYSYFDTAANRYLIEAGGLDIHATPVVGFVVESTCRYMAPVAFPQALIVGVRVDQLTAKSVTYGIGIFADGADTASAAGEFVHVFVARASGRAASIPDDIHSALERIVFPSQVG